MIKKIIKIFLVILCMITIFMFSNDKAETSTRKSDRLIIRITETVLGHKLSIKEKEKYTTIFFKPVRKCAHATIYFILGLLVISLLKEYMTISNKALLYSIIVVFLYACSDEIHQLFVQGRSGEILDVLIDTIGGTIGCFLYKLIYDRRKKYE